MSTADATAATDVQAKEDLDRTIETLPAQVGDFIVDGFLGEGGLSCVYRATRRSNGEVVALKTLKPSALENGAERRHIAEHGCGHLETDYKIASRFDHPNILRVLSVHPDDEIPHLVMELYSSVTFHDFISDGEKHSQANGRHVELIPHFRHYVEQMCAALREVHRAGLVHCDVKPGNFLVDPQHHVKLMDFSYARPIYVEGRFTPPRNASGTNAFMSKEQKIRWPLDARSDIYSLGRALYVMLTGQLPFAERREMSNKELRETPVTPDAHRVNPHVTQELADLLINMMEEISVNRPTSIEEVLARFREIQPFAE